MGQCEDQSHLSKRVIPSVQSAREGACILPRLVPPCSLVVWFLGSLFQDQIS